MSDNAHSENRLPENVQQAVTAFEKILEVMPDDRMALEALYEAHINGGDTVKALEYLIRLADLVIAHPDATTAVYCCIQLNLFADFYPDAKTRLDKIQRHLDEQPAAGIEPVLPAAPRDSRNIHSELVMAWTLFEAGELSQDQYSSVVNDLTELSARENETVSVLQVIHDRGFKNAEAVLAFLVHKSGRPLVNLTTYDIPRDLHGVLPLDFMVRNGVIIFEKMNSEMLVAMLNPLDHDLQSSIRTMTARTCHFYLCRASDFNTALASIRKQLAPGAAKA